MLVSSFLDTRNRPAIVVTEDSPENPKNGYGDNSDDEEDEEQGTSSIISNGRSRSSGKNEFLRVGSNDSTAENYGDDDDYNFDDEDDEDLSHCSVATMNRYGTFESLEKLEGDDGLGTLPDFRNNMPRSKARFTFDDDDDDDEDLFEEDFESDFNFRFPGQIQDNTYSKLFSVVGRWRGGCVGFVLICSLLRELQVCPGLVHCLRYSKRTMRMTCTRTIGPVVKVRTTRPKVDLPVPPIFKFIR